MASSVSRIGNSTSIEPGIARIETVKPLARKTLIMPWFSGRTSATNMVMSCRVASCASWPNRIEPMPLPWNSSVTERLISARTALHSDVLGAADHPTLVAALEDE